MATYTPVVDVNITINLVALAQAGFGLPIFLDHHTAFTERVRQYSGATEVLEDFDNDSNAPAYKAALNFFKSSPSPDFIKIGRRSAQWNGVLTGFNSVSGEETTHTISIAILDKLETFSASVTATTDQTEQEYIEAIATLINDSDVGTTTGAGYVNAAYQAGALIITPLMIGATEEDEDVVFTVTAEEELVAWSGEYSGYENASQAIASIRNYDDDWYFLTTSDRNKSWVEDVAEVIQSAKDEVQEGTPSVGKMYFYGTGDTENIYGSTEAGVDTSLSGKLRDNNYTRTVGYYHHLAGANSETDVDYPECAYVGYNCVYDAGTVTWANLRIDGIAASKVSTSGRNLNSNEKNRLAKRNINFSEVDAGVTITRTGITSGNEWIDIIRGVDWLTSEVETALKRLLFRQQGTRVGYTNQGLTQVREVIQSALQTAVNRGFLQSYEIYVPSLSVLLSTSAGVTNWINRVLTDVTFTGYLAGAIHEIKLNGSVEAPTSETTA